MNTICPHLFIIKSLLKSLSAHFDIINRTLDIFRNRYFSVVAKYPGNRKRWPLSQKMTYTRKPGALRAPTFLGPCGAGTLAARAGGLPPLPPSCLIFFRVNMSYLVQSEHVWSCLDWTCLILFGLNMSDLVQSEHVWSRSEWTCLILSGLNRSDPVRFCKFVTGSSREAAAQNVFLRV